MKYDRVVCAYLFRDMTVFPKSGWPIVYSAFFDRHINKKLGKEKCYLHNKKSTGPVLTFVNSYLGIFV